MRNFAAEQNLEVKKRWRFGMAEKSAEFVTAGGKIYHGNLPEGT